LTLRTISPFAVIVPFYWLYSQYNLWNNHLGMMSIYWVINLPIVVWMMRGFFSDIPKEIWEAATIHGASEFMILRKVALPLVIPGLIATIIFAFVLTWNEFLYASILTGPDTGTVTKGIWFGMGEAGGFKVVEWDDINTGGVLAFLPALALIVLIRKYLVRGFTLGSAR
jgi:multiple sugar transport system permease protein